ncbi:hypothetical protein SDC9_12143 [bioreactor metagenome]|uniref:Uncharacterized protein n=2 Tax=root TaxID=1 RepID=A0A652ZYI5_9SPIR|nr:hypothetical protein TRIP_E370063 [uncultured Spirochaetota bacterium]
MLYNSRSGSRCRGGGEILRRGKSGLNRARCRITSGTDSDRSLWRQGRIRTESATENIPLPRLVSRWAVRVKRRGKGSPHIRRRIWQGKPHREQGRTAVDGPSTTALGRRKPRVDRLTSGGNDGCRGMAAARGIPRTEPGLQTRSFFYFNCGRRLYPEEGPRRILMFDLCIVQVKSSSIGDCRV